MAKSGPERGGKLKKKLSRKQITWGLTIFLAGAAILLVYFILSRITVILGTTGKILQGLSSVLYGIVIAYVFTPVLNFFELKLLKPLFKKLNVDVSANNPRGFRRMRRISVALTICFIIGILFAFFRFVGPQVVSSIQTIVSNFSVYVDNIQNFLSEHLKNNPELANGIDSFMQSSEARIDEFMEKTVNPAISTAITRISKSIISIVRNVFNFTVGLIVSVYLFYSKDKLAAQFKQIIYALFKEKTANEIVSECRYIHRVFVGFLTGKILDSIIIGILCFICIKFIGTPFPVLISFIIGVTNIIPFFGPYIGGIIGSLIVFMVDPLQALYFLIFVIVLQQFDGNILGPLILGDSTGLSSFWVIFAIMFFGAMFGVAGWVIGVPAFAVAYDLIRRKIHSTLEKKKYPSDLSPYMDLAYIENGELLPHSDENIKYNAQQPGSNWKRLLHIKDSKAAQKAKAIAGKLQNDQKSSQAQKTAVADAESPEVLPEKTTEGKK